jgi:uncharacterized protein YecT (DUF1311 family)
MLVLCSTVLVHAEDRQELRAKAQQALDAEAAREKAGDCPTANNTYEWNTCLSRQVEVTGENYQAFAGALRGLLIPAEAAEFDNVEQAWKLYLRAQCAAVFHGYQGGTGGPSAEGECSQRLTRAHMRDLDHLYAGPLHL